MHRHSIQDAADIDQSEVWSPCWWVAVKVAAWEDRIGVEWSTQLLLSQCTVEGAC
jgi:hypothetical protein